MKANANLALLEIIRSEGLGIDAVSLGEVMRAFQAGFVPEQVSYNGNNVSDAEMEAVVSAGVHVSMDSISQLERHAWRFEGRALGLRINPDVGGGHHDHVITGGPESKFGIEHDRIQDAVAVATRYDVAIDGLQQHIGSGVLEVATFLHAMEVLLEAGRGLEGLRFIDFGGGFGIPYRPDERPFDLEGFGLDASRILSAFGKAPQREITFRFEPGRICVASCGTLLVTVTAVKRDRRHTFVGTDSGFNHLVRPVLYGSYHRIENLTNPDGHVERVSVVGNICESGDVFAKDRAMPRCREGDILALRDVGAYGYSMASTYNLRPRPAEVLITSAGPEVIRPRETLDELLAR
jgi:diaminopimelate decarboxylase